MSELMGPVLEGRPEPKPVPWRGRDALWVIILGFLISQPLLVLIAVIFVPDAINEAAESRNLQTLTALGTIIFAPSSGLAIWLWTRYRYKVGLDLLGFRNFGRSTLKAGLRTGLLGLAAGYGSVIVLNLIVSAVSGALGKDAPTPGQQLDIDSEMNVALLAAMGFVVVVITPIVEEAVYRGFLYRGLRRSLAVWPAIVASSFFFGIAHLVGGLSLWHVAVATAVLGILLARTVDEHDSLVPAVVAHMLFNAVGFGLLLSQI